MIEFRQENLENDKERDLRNWMNKPEFHLLVAVVESKMLLKELDALTKATGSKQFPDYKDKANIELGEAIRYREFLEVLKEVKDSKEPFKLAKPTNNQR